MKRFNFERYGDDDYEDDHDDEFEDEDSKPNENMIDSQLVALQMEQNILLEQEINEKILVDSINICSSSFFWRFKSNKKKLKLIEEVYNSLKKMLES